MEVGDAEASVAVFKGNVSVEAPSGTVQVGKKQTATFDLANNDTSTLAKNLEPDPYDSWDKQETKYQDPGTQLAARASDRLKIVKGMSEKSQ